MKYTICVALLPKLTEKLNAFKKKYEKYGESEFSFEISEKYPSKTHGNKTIWVVDVEINGSYKINDYEFVASLEYIDEKGKNLVKTISSDVEVPAVYYTRCECDHCKVSRYRKYTVLLKNTETGKYVQVGKSCVKDYLGVDIANYACYLSIWESIDEYIDSINNESYGFKARAYEVEDILCQTLEQIKRDGYISKQTANENWVDSTSSRVWHAINEDTDRYGKPYYPLYEITDESREKAKTIKEYINGLDEEESAYIHDLKLLLSCEYVEGDKFGLVVSAVGFYLREINKKIEKARKIASQYVGNVGDKITFTATPNCVYSDYTQFGSLYIYKFTVDNNEIIWKTSKPLDEKEVTIKATIKEHSDFRGIKQTVITRGKVM